MLTAIRYHSRKKMPVLLLVLCLCVQSLGFASHGMQAKPSQQTGVAEHAMSACPDMPYMQIASTSTQEHAKPAMPCCEHGQCADAHCMMPAGTHFEGISGNFFIAYSADELITEIRSISSIKPSPPIRPPIA
ncbi:MAG: hypothetical protein ACREPB_14105 [Arenimonas sp.]